MPHIFLRRCKKRWRVETVEGNATIRGAVAQYLRFVLSLIGFVTPPTWVTFGRCSAHSACAGAALFFGFMQKMKIPSFMARNISAAPDLQIWTHSFRGFHMWGWLAGQSPCSCNVALRFIRSRRPFLSVILMGRSRSHCARSAAPHALCRSATALHAAPHAIHPSIHPAPCLHKRLN